MQYIQVCCMTAQTASFVLMLQDTGHSFWQVQAQQHLSPTHHAWYINGLMFRSLTIHCSLSACWIAITVAGYHCLHILILEASICQGRPNSLASHVCSNRGTSDPAPILRLCMRRCYCAMAVMHTENRVWIQGYTTDTSTNTTLV